MSGIKGKSGVYKRIKPIWNKNKKETRPEVLKKLSESHKGQISWNKGRKGDKHPPYSEKTKEKMRKIMRKPEFQNRRVETRRNNGWFKDPKVARENISKGNKGKKRTNEQNKRNRERQIKNPNRKFKDTSIELKVEAELQRRNINYQKQVPLCNIAIVDFYLPEYRIVIQCDGCFYHGCPIHFPNWTRNKIRDKRQDRVLIFNGFNVYRFWEHEINRSVKNCINKLLIC